MWTDFEKKFTKQCIKYRRPRFLGLRALSTNIVQRGFAQARIILLIFFCQRMNALRDKLRNSIFPNFK